MTYVAQYFHAFSVMGEPAFIGPANEKINAKRTIDRADVLARRVTMFADTIETIWTSRNDYERRASLVGQTFHVDCIVFHFLLTLTRLWSAPNLRTQSSPNMDIFLALFDVPRSETRVPRFHTVQENYKTPMGWTEGRLRGFIGQHWSQIENI